jgi:ferritin-like metal-binding protein YciE
MEMQSLQDLFEDELKDTYNAEKQILKALPRMAKKASSEALREAFEMHEEETREHVQRLEQVFKLMGKSARGKHCKAMEGIVEEGKEMMAEDMEPEVMDAALIAAAQRVEHYEIAAYGTLRTFAQHLGQKDIARLLQQTLDNEGETDKKLTKLAVAGINQRAS